MSQDGRHPAGTITNPWRVQSYDFGPSGVRGATRVAPPTPPTFQDADDADEADGHGLIRMISRLIRDNPHHPRHPRTKVLEPSMLLTKMRRNNKLKQNAGALARSRFQLASSAKP
jgi:hypothetical protein